MKDTSIIILAVFAVGMVVFPPESSLGEQASAETQRWDRLMIEESRIWKKLLVRYGYAEHQKYWPERKAALETIVNEFGDSRWADDAALILACGKASFENDTVGVIAALEKVAIQYPNGQAIVADWYPDNGCRFDETWLRWVSNLVFLCPDGTVEGSNPFGRYGRVSQLEKEALAYFIHLNKYPRDTKVVVQLFTAEILNQKGNRAGAIAALKKITSNSEHLAEVNEADRTAASKPDGYYIRGLWRPEYRAFLTLIDYYEEQGDIDKAVTRAGNLLDLCSRDGWYWTINRRIGDFYNRCELRSQAKEQYRLALTGLQECKNAMDERSKLVYGSDIPDNFWENNRRELEEKLIDSN